MSSGPWLAWVCERHDEIRTEPPPPGELPYCPLATAHDIHKMRPVSVMPVGDGGEGMAKALHELANVAEHIDRYYATHHADCDLIDTCDCLYDAARSRLSERLVAARAVLDRTEQEKPA